MATSTRAEGTRAPLSEPIEVYGDASYGTAEVLTHLEEKGASAKVKVQAPSMHEGLFSKDAFRIDLANNTVTCPNERLVSIRRSKDGSGMAEFGLACKACPLAPSCTTSKRGRTIRLHKHERQLLQERANQKNPAWRASYKATRPKVERKLAHLMHRRHGGRRARVRGTERIAQDFAMRSAAVNLNRLAILGLHSIERSGNRHGACKGEGRPTLSTHPGSLGPCRRPVDFMALPPAWGDRPAANPHAPRG